MPNCDPRDVRHHLFAGLRRKGASGSTDPLTGPEASRDDPPVLPGRTPTRLRPHDLRGRNLRFALLTLLWQAGRPCSIGELHQQLQRLGLSVGGGDPAKTLGDVLRYELRKGRVARVSRGHYTALPRPDTTTRRHRDRLRDLVAEAERRRPEVA